MTASTGTSSSNSGVFDLPEDGMMSKSKNNNNNINAGSSSDGGSNKNDLVQQQSSSSSAETDRYLQGDELHRLRQRVLNMRQSLQEARESGHPQQIQQLSRSILSAQQADGEFMYQVSLERMEAAQQAGLFLEAEQYRRAAKEARASLPQFQLEGLWVGKYGDTFQMVNVSYCGDVLTAHKVTGDGHVPKGEITFQVDLSPSYCNSNECLDPIELTNDAVQQWGSRYLQRHAGLGQVAADGFKHSQWLDGQLILVNQYFSFAWLPTGHQVFFGRPSAELTLKLLRHSQQHHHSLAVLDNPNYPLFAEDVTNNNDGIHSSFHSRQHLARCLEETELLDDDMEVSDGIFQSHDQHFYYDKAGCFE